MIRASLDLLQDASPHASMVVRIVHQCGRFRKAMPPIWPFGKKKQPLQLAEEPPAPVIYRKTGDQGISSGSTDQQKKDYKAALSFFGNGNETVERATDQSKHYDGVVASSQPATPATKEVVDWHHHTDGYHYKKLPDGAFDPVPYVRSQDGTYTPYS